jgi:peroxiredoxin
VVDLGLLVPPDHVSRGRVGVTSRKGTSMTNAFGLTLLATAWTTVITASVCVAIAAADTSCPDTNETGSRGRELAPASKDAGQAGIGIAVKTTEGKVFVGAVLPGTPASGSNVIKPNDRILAVGEGNKEPIEVTGMDMAKVVGLIRGPKGTVVRLSIVPAGMPEANVLVVSMIRGEVKLLSTFGDGTLIPRGAKAPNIKFTRLSDGKEGELSEYLGRIVVLEVWASWCRPCLKNIRGLETLAAQHPEWQGKVELLAVSADEDRENAVACWKAQQWTKSAAVWTGPSILKAYRLGGLPGAFVIDQKGLVVANDPSEISEVLKRLLVNDGSTIAQ